MALWYVAILSTQSVFLPTTLTAQWHPRPDPEETVDFQSSDLPIIWIDTHGQEIENNPRIIADMGVIDNGKGQRNHPTDPCNVYMGKIAIELRGSSSLRFPKKQYRFETQDSAGNNLNVSLLGMPKENDWILHGPYGDESLIRNVLAYGLSNAIGRYASRTRFCELVLDGDYRGLYVLMEKIKRDNDRVDISALDADDLAGDSLTGGYLIKIDKFAGENVGGWRSTLGIQYQYDYPKNGEIVPGQAAYIRDFMDRFEQAMMNDWTMGPLPAYRPMIDLESFVDHFILNEFCKNVDAYRISAYMYKDRDSKGGLLTMGPIWDFDLTMAKAWYEQDLGLTEGWQIDYRENHSWDGFQVPVWWEKLAHDPSFQGPAQARWMELRKGALHKDSLMARIDGLTAEITEARIRNFQKWPGLLEGTTYEAKIAELKQWISDRIAWIDTHIGSLYAGAERNKEPVQPDDFNLEQNYPNPFNASTVIGSVLPVTGKASIAIVDHLGRKVRILASGVQPAGRHRIAWDGKDDLGRSAPSGVYLVRMSYDGRMKTGKLLLMR
jgi:hypothetical protein